MRRREFLTAASTVGAASLSGCLALEAYWAQPDCAVTELVDSPPEDTVYLPTHRDDMVMLGSDTAGDYEVSFSYTYPHMFWTVNGTRTELVEPSDDDEVHFMVTVSDAETGIPIPADTGASLEILRGGETVFERSPWLMVSQTMGFHLGDNIPLGEGTPFGDGTEYVARLTLGDTDARLAEPLEGLSGGGETAEVEFVYSRNERNEIGCEVLDEDRWGEPGALEPMEHDHEDGHGDGHEDTHDNDDGHADGHDNDHEDGHADAPAEFDVDDEMGRIYDEVHEHDGVHGTHDGMDGVEMHAEDDTLFVFENRADEGYLAVHALTPYNRHALPYMELEAVIEREGETVFDDRLVPTVDGTGYHYGADVDAQEGDTVRVEVVTPPQISRHPGYQTAFLRRQTVEATL